MLWSILLALVVQGAAPPPRPLESGDHSNMDEPRQAVARSAAEWDALWRLHAPERPQPRVDFSKEMVVGVFLGNRPTAGFAVTIVSVDSSAAGTTVKYRETTPGPGAVAAQVITSAFCLMAVPARSGTVTFERVN